MKCAIGAARGTARLSGTKHEAFSIAGDQSGGEEVPVIALNNLIDDGKVAAGGKFLIKLDVEGVEIEAIPMYNLTRGPKPGELFHDKGRGDGYVLDVGGMRIYLSGDTKCTPEMKALKDIDVAFVCMNLPYTMDVTQAAQGVLAFKPKVVYPYHYRGQDVNTFKKLVNEGDKNIAGIRAKEVNGAFGVSN